MPPSRSSRYPIQRWQIADFQPDRAAQLGQSLQLSPLLAQILINRGVGTPESARQFLEPEQQFLPSPLDDFPDLTIAIEILLNAISSRQFIAICGDYDADGMTSTALLLRALRYLGAVVDYAIPSRMQEGYGINRRIIEEFHQDGVSVILTVDNGIAAHEPIAFARELGLAVIVTDHHDIPPTLPDANAILNPKLIREESPYRGVAGVGVAYILAICLAQCLQKTQDLTTPLLELFTLGTIADLAPLTGVNRRWVKRGLKLLPASRNPGIEALIQVAGLSNEKALKPEAIGFRLGPRINAIGRLADPQIVIELLTTEDDGRALELAMKCEQVNQLRQRLCELIEQEAIVWCEQTRFQPQKERVLVVVQPNWHHGVIGIVASRLVERYGVPVFIGTYEDESEQQIRGSARSIPEFNVFEALQFCGDILEKFGGHRAAGGFSFKAAHLEEMRSRLRIFAHNQLQPQHLKPLVTIDVQANFRDLTHDLYEQLDTLHPCGIENPDPVFWTPNVRVIEQQTIGRDKNHLKMTLAQTNDPAMGIRALAWRWGEFYPLPDRVDVAYRLRLNEWNGTKSIELELVGVRPAEGSQNSSSSGLTDAFTAIKTDLNLAAGSEIPMNGSLNGRSRSQANPSIQPIDLSVNPLVSRSMNGLVEPMTEPSGNPPAHQANGTAPSFNLDRSTQEESANYSSDYKSDYEKENEAGDASFIPFVYNHRHYLCRIKSSAIGRESIGRELRIRNAEGQILTLYPDQQQGWMGEDRATGQAIDLSQAFYFNLMQAALSALEIAEKDQLIQEKDREIAALTQQVESLKQKLKQFSLAATAPISPSVSSSSRPPALIPDGKIAALATVLSAKAQREIIAIDPAEFEESDLFDADADFSEAGLRLCEVIEREIVQPIFDRLQQSGLIIALPDYPALYHLPPLLANEWSALREELLLSPDCPQQHEYDDVISDAVSEADREQICACLSNWQTPIALWLLHPQAASVLSQIDQLQAIAADEESCLYGWQFDLLRSFVLGGN
ncbi:single-stranded-DNA-specific exonuclease RecJ [Leptolyngbya ohadii]|uniref:single-stranded-DNA-specific exonuclease RecJ n=1 Tax=Leptolyngbya ohadii TaxID=1962290 RepID=UPI000B598662|nr:single-stranded-DNA-specific exonuclease RecJ [Leptolyngbya ohadii]